MAEAQAPFVQSILNQMGQAGKPKVTTTTTQYPKQPIDLAQIGILVAMLLGDKGANGGMNNVANAMNDSFAASPAGNPFLTPQGLSSSAPAGALGLGGMIDSPMNVGGLTPAALRDLFKTKYGTPAQPTFNA